MQQPQENHLEYLPSELLILLMRNMGENFAALSLLNKHFFYVADALSKETKRQLLLSYNTTQVNAGGKTFTLDGYGNVFISANDGHSRENTLLLGGIVQIVAGSKHVLCLDRLDNVWGFGSNDVGQLGLGKDIKQQEEFVLILKNIKQVLASESFSICLDNEGDVWGFGDNQEGQLGIGDTTLADTPVCAVQGYNIKQIAVGHDFTLCLAENGHLWGFGRNGGNCTLGLGDTSGQTTPVRIIDLENIDSVVTGWQHTVCLDKKGNICGFGNTYDSQLAFLLDPLTGGQEFLIKTPQTVPYPGIIKIIAANNFTRIIVQTPDGPKKEDYGYDKPPIIGQQDARESHLHSLVLLWDKDLLQELANDKNPFIAEICSKAYEKKCKDTPLLVADTMPVPVPTHSVQTQKKPFNPALELLESLGNIGKTANMELADRKRMATKSVQKFIHQVKDIRQFLSLLPLITLCGKESTHALGYIRKTTGLALNNFDDTTTYKSIMRDIKARGLLLVEFAKESGIILSKTEYVILCKIINSKAGFFETTLPPYEKSVFLNPGNCWQYVVSPYSEAIFLSLLSLKEGPDINEKMVNLLEKALKMAREHEDAKLDWCHFFDYTAAFQLTGIYLPMMLDRIQAACGTEYTVDLDIRKGTAPFIVIKHEDGSNFTDMEIDTFYTVLENIGFTNSTDTKKNSLS